jgi:hypothetical protein
MTRTRIAAIALAFVMLVAAGAAGAQTRFGLAAGVAMPTGDFGDVSNPGVNIEANVELQPGGMPFAIRGDLFLNRFGLDEDEIGESGSVRGLGAALSALFQLRGAGMTPYLLVGPMLANLDVSLDDSSDEPDIGTNAGLQGGAGVKFPLSGMIARVEVRVAKVFSDDDESGVPDANWINVNFGVLFGGRR